VSLAGGIGNQLFQLFACALVANEERILVEGQLGKPSLDEDRIPKSLKWRFPFDVSTYKVKKYNYVLQKEFNFLLGTSQDHNPRFLRSIVVKQNHLLNQIGLGESRLISTTREFLADLEAPSKSSAHLLGYFQTSRGIYEFIRRNRFQVSLLHELAGTVAKFRSELEDEGTVFLHARSGDYSSEPKIGIVAMDYYERSLRKIWEVYGPQRIYLFSDNSELFISRASELIKENLVFVCDPKVPDYLQFEMLRLGKKYVIANSTFSWMATSLSEADDLTVYAPKPWFEDLDDPIDLIPNSWIEVSR
jgi:hypothetical protein